MYVAVYPLILGILILLASLISLRMGLAVAIIEIIPGAIAGNLGILQSEAWMIYVASFGSRPEMVHANSLRRLGGYEC